MRVLQVMECTIGGTRRHLRDLVLGLLERGVEVGVACAARREPRMREDMERMRAKGATVHEIAMVRRIAPVRDLADFGRIGRVLWGKGFHVVHTHSSKAGALGRLAALVGSGAARVHTPHTYAFSFRGGHGQGGESAGPAWLVRGTEVALGRLTDRHIHVSRAEMEEGQRLGVVPPGRARVVYNGIDPRPFAARAGGADVRRELGIPPGARVVGAVGLLNDAKGYDVLLEAVARLPATVHVLLVGQGEREPNLRAQAERLGLVARLHFAGWRDDLLACLDAMDVFALPSRWEGLAYSLLEAMAAGLPCVSTEVNGSREALEPGDGGPPAGLLVPVEDPGALAGALGRVLDDEALRRSLAAAGPPRVAAHFSVDAMVDGTLAVYREVG